ncbi:GGDEF domain-containing protein, partial [Pseudomonas syringae pv. tagetis]
MRAQHDETADGPNSFSGGIASLKPAENNNDRFKDADENLYLAKRNGRKSIAFERRIISATALTGP